MALTEEQLTYEFMSKVPTSWLGKAYICPAGHQMHELRFKYAEYWHKDAHCKGGCGWIDQTLFTYDNEYKKRTEGRKEREDEPKG